MNERHKYQMVKQGNLIILLEGMMQLIWAVTTYTLRVLYSIKQTVSAYTVTNEKFCSRDMARRKSWLRDQLAKFKLVVFCLYYLEFVHSVSHGDARSAAASKKHPFGHQ